MTVPTLPMWFRDEITVIRPGSTVDRYSDTTEDWVAATEVTYKNCLVEPAANPPEDRGSGDNREAVRKNYTLVAPPTVDLRATDRVRWNNVEYLVDGEPMRWRSPNGLVDNVYAHLFRVEG